MSRELRKGQASASLLSSPEQTARRVSMQRSKNPRYEFRIFAANLRVIASRLSGMAEERKETVSSETYIVARLNIDCNVKRRNNRLDVKILQARKGVLELWAPALCAELPIPLDVFERKVISPLGVACDLSGSIPLSWDAILDFTKTNPALKCIHVHKKRMRFTIPPTWAEFVDLKVKNQGIQSVAIEAEDPDAVLQLVKSVGFRAYQNESYPCYLQNLAFGKCPNKQS